jgi:hypothetical protein
MECLLAVAEKRFYLEDGFYSLYDYLHRGLGLSRNKAFKRATAATLMLRHPQLFEFFKADRLSLSHIVLLAGKVSDSSVETIVSKIEGLSLREAEHFMAGHDRDGGNGTGAATHTLILKVSEETLQELERVRQLLTTADTHLDTAGALAAVLDFYLEKNDPLRKAERRRLQQMNDGSQPQLTCQAADVTVHAAGTGSDRPHLHVEKKVTETKEDDSRYIPAHVRHEVMLRDKGQCTYTSSDGRRCEARTRLHFDHIVPWARGGTHAAENLRLLCPAHNQLLARQFFGHDFIRHKIAQNRKRVQGKSG